MPVIETHDLRKVFKSRRGPVEAVKGVDMHVEQGEIFGFLGPNGAGKTTTLRMLSTLLHPTAGRAMVAGHDLLKEPKKVRERIGYVSQSGGVETAVTARENLLLQAQLYNMSKRDALVRAAELIKDLELESFADRVASTYSGGQKRRLDVALGMVHRPTLLFLDEPTTGLDPQSRARMWDEVTRMRESGTTVFLTTHYLEEADALCDRLAIIDDGRIVAAGTPSELKREIAGDVVLLGVEAHGGGQHKAEELLIKLDFVREVQHGGEGLLRLYVEHGEQALPQILRTLDGAHLGITTISLSRPSLDDVFLTKTGRSLRDAD
jgi:ABC-2 type transport system ATP-binding protein